MGPRDEHVFEPSDMRAVETAVARFGDAGKALIPEIFCLVVAIDPIKHSVTLADVQRG